MKDHWHELELSYSVDGEPVSERIRFATTPCHFGGVRPWFLCPGCDRRVGKLYFGGRFRCRHCFELAYPGGALDPGLLLA